MKKRRGWYCWVCERRRPNERFGRKGRKKHVCRTCSMRLGHAEIAIRGELRNVECIPRGPMLGARARERLAPYRTHPEPRVRALVVQLLVQDAEARARRQAERIDEALWEDERAAWEEERRRYDDVELDDCGEDRDGWTDQEIPY